MYKFETREFDLTEEEQERAKFIIEVAETKNKEWAAGLHGMAGLEKAAFEEFKYKFYSDIRLRLNEYPSAIPNACWSITPDGKKAIKMEIIKSDS